VTELTFRAMNTDWCILADDPAAMREAERRVRDVEARLSRFLPGSALSRLNQQRRAEDPLLAAVLREALRLRDLTGGAFDPTLGAAVLAAGYDRSFELLDRPQRGRPDANPRPRVHLDGDHVELEGDGLIDLGGIAKGYAVDLAAAGLRAPYLVDGGGDIRVGGPGWPIGVAEDRAVIAEDQAVATSSTLARRWVTADGERGHHIITPRSGLPSSAAEEAVVVAPDAATADALATALIADPVATLPALSRLGAEAMLRAAGWWMTPGMAQLLT